MASFTLINTQRTSLRLVKTYWDSLYGSYYVRLYEPDGQGDWQLVPEAEYFTGDINAALARARHLSLGGSI